MRSTTRLYDAQWEVHEVDLEEIVLAYLGYPDAQPAPAVQLDEAMAR